jgi:hypothetical protein
MLTTNPDSTNTALLLQWDLSAIPTTAIVSGVVITFHKIGQDFYEDAIGLRLETPNAEWAESCTWNQVIAGGLTLVGTNELNPLLASPYISSANGAALIGAIQAWVSNPSSNHGLFITQFIDMYSYVSFRSREGGGGPTITVTYTIPPILSVTPQDDLQSTGRLGGPYVPLSKDYTLQNTGAGTLHWTVSPAWQNAPFPFTVSSASGSLGLGQSTTVTVSVNESYPFEDGTNVSDTIYFDNADNGLGSTSRGADITISDLVFCSDFADGTAQGWGFRDGSGLTTDLAHSDSYSIRAFDPAGYGDAAECYRVFAPVAKGKAEFWMNVPSTSTAPVQVYLSDETGWQKAPDHRFLVTFNLDGKVRYYHNGGYADFSGLPSFAFDVWTKITLTWDSGTNELFLRINDVGKGIGLESNPGGDIDQIVFQKDGSDKTGVFAHIDDICVWFDDNPIPPPQKDDFVGTWDAQGVYYRNSNTGGWIAMASPATMITTGDLDGDGTADLIGLWPSQGGIWVKYSLTGAWARLSSTASYIGSGDMNGDGRADLVGTWAGQGVYYRDSISGVWVKLASEATMITAGDLDGNGTDDLIGLWPEQGGIWVKYSGSGAWARLSSTAVHIAAGDMNGDGRDDLLGTWDGQGAYYRDSISGAWVKMASPATLITAGDLDGDMTDDLIGIWPTQGGVWAKYSLIGAWARLSSTARDIAAGKMRSIGAPAPVAEKASAAGRAIESPLPMGGYAEGPGAAVRKRDLSSEGPGGGRFVFIEDKNLVPTEARSAELARISGPGEPGFIASEQKNPFPRESRGSAREVKKKTENKGKRAEK